MQGNKAEILKGTPPWRVPCGMLAGGEFAFFFESGDLHNGLATWRSARRFCMESTCGAAKPTDVLVRGRGTILKT